MKKILKESDRFRKNIAEISKFIIRTPEFYVGDIHVDTVGMTFSGYPIDRWSKEDKEKFCEYARAEYEAICKRRGV